MNSKKLTFTDDVPGKRSRHSTVTKNDSMYIFGGTDDSSKMNDMWEFNSISLKWKKIEKQIVLPSKRSGQTCCVYQDYLILFGGYDQSSCNDVYFMSFKNMEWRKLTTYGEIPAKRNHHSAVLHHDQMIIFGGHGWDSTLNLNIFFNDVYLFDLKNFVWKMVPTSGDIPSKRFDHSAVIFDECMYVFGGEDKNFMNDLHVLNLKTMEWKLIDTLGDRPSKRSGHKAIVHRTMIPSESNMIVFGGYDSTYSNEMFSYNFSTGYWKKLDLIGAYPSRRYDHGMALLNDKLYIFGGNGEINLLNDTYVMEMENTSQLSLLNLVQTSTKPPKFADFKLNCLLGRELLAHRCILSQSKYFEEFFREPGSDEMDIDATYEVVMDVLIYLYTGELPTEINNHLVQIIQLVQKFKMEALESLLLSKFKANLSSRNAFEFLTTAWHQKNDYLVSICIQYYHANTEAFTKEEKSKLDKDILIEFLEDSHKVQEVYHHKKEKNLYEHIVDLYHTKEYSDVLFVTRDKKSLAAHRSIITTFNEYFAALLDHSFQESGTHEILMDDVDHDTLELVLRYIYTKGIANLSDPELLMKLVRFSDYAVMKDLYSITIQKLLSSISNTNAIEVYEFTLEFDMDPRIKQKCIQVINEAPKDNLIEIILAQQEQIKVLKDQVKRK